jgi:hypothetical protein
MVIFGWPEARPADLSNNKGRQQTVCYVTRECVSGVNQCWLQILNVRVVCQSTWPRFMIHQSGVPLTGKVKSFC